MIKSNKEIIEKLRNVEKSFYDYSIKKEEKQKSFISKLQVYNHKSGEIKKMSYDLKTDYKYKYNDLIQRSIYITEKSNEEGLNCCIFITLTNNTQYHPFTKNNTEYNKNYKGFSIFQSYENLNKFWRNVYKEFSKNDNGREKIKYRFIKVIEKHKSFQPHTHILLFIKKTDLENVLNILENKGKITSKEKNKDKILYNGNYKKNKNNEIIGRFEVEILRDLKKGVGYLSKYIRKQFTETPYVLDGWKSKSKIRLIQTSNIEIPKYVYKILNRFVDNEIKQNINTLSYIVKNTTLKEIITENHNITQNEKTKVLNSVFEVFVYKKIKNIHIENIEDLLNNEEIKKSFIKIKELEEETFFSNIDLVEMFYEDFYEYVLEIIKTQKISEITNIQVFKNKELVYEKNDFLLLGNYIQEEKEDFKNVDFQDLGEEYDLF